MSKPSHVPPMAVAAVPQPAQIPVPMIELQGNIQVGTQQAPDGSTRKVLVFGPVMLCVPLTDEAASGIASGLTGGIQIARPGDLAGL